MGEDINMALDYTDTLVTVAFGMCGDPGWASYCTPGNNTMYWYYTPGVVASNRPVDWLTGGPTDGRPNHPMLSEL